MTGIVGIRTPLFHHCRVRLSSPTTTTIGARHPLAAEVYRSMPPSRNVARQHRHIVTTHPPKHQLITPFNDTRRRLHPSRQYLEFVRSTSSLLWTTSTARRLQQKTKERRRKKSAKEARRRKTEDKDPISQLRRKLRLSSRRSSIQPKQAHATNPPLKWSLSGWKVDRSNSVKKP